MKKYLFIIFVCFNSLALNAQDSLILDILGSWNMVETKLVDTEGVFKNYCDSAGLDLDLIIDKMNSAFVGINFNFQENGILTITNSPESIAPVNAKYRWHKDPEYKLEICDSKIFCGKPYDIFLSGSKLILIYSELGGKLLLHLIFEPN